MWPAFTDPSLTERWYYQLRVEGDWRAGGKLTWRTAGGTAAEEGVIKAVGPPNRLEVETRFLFSPELSAEPAHLTTWEVEPRDGGSLVRVTREFSREGPASKVAAGDGDGALLGLRIAVDPVAQAEIARLESIGPVEVRDVTPDRVGDYQAFFDRDAFRDFPAWRGCYCVHPLIDGTDEEWAMRSGDENRAEGTQLLVGEQTTALMAYVGERPVGWCHYGATDRFRLLVKRFELQPDERQKVGSIACFVIAAPYRGLGVAGRLLEAACDRLRGGGHGVGRGLPRQPRHTAGQLSRSPDHVPSGRLRAPPGRRHLPGHAQAS